MIADAPLSGSAAGRGERGRPSVDDVARGTGPAHTRHGQPHVRLLARELLTGALYLALVLLAGLVALPEDRLPGDGVVVGGMVGTAVGLMLAHWLAFRLAAGVTAERGVWSREAVEEGVAQLVGGTAVAVLAALPFLLADGRAAVLVSLGVLAALPVLTGAAIARLRGASAVRTVWTASVALAVALVVVGVKAAVGH